MQGTVLTVPCSLADSSPWCGWVKTHPYITLEEIKPPSAREVPRRGGGREPCHSPKYFGQPYSSLPHRLRAEPPRRGGQGETVGAAIGRPPALRQPLPSRVDDEHRPLRRRGGFHIRPEGLPLPQASAGDHWSPLQNKSSPCTFMQDELWLGRRGSNSRMRESKSRALPLGDDPL